MFRRKKFSAGWCFKIGEEHFNALPQMKRIGWWKESFNEIQKFDLNLRIFSDFCATPSSWTSSPIVFFLTCQPTAIRNPHKRVHLWRKSCLHFQYHPVLKILCSIMSWKAQNYPMSKQSTLRYFSWGTQIIWDDLSKIR